MNKKNRKNSLSSRSSLTSWEVDPVGLRIIGGIHRGRKIAYAGDRRVRPMKDRVREAVFNLLLAYKEDFYALDLFGGTGALGLEAISRGARGATFVEMHFPTARVIQQNISTLGLNECTQLHTGNVFLWNKRKPEIPRLLPWLVFCCPPYELFLSQADELRELLSDLYEQALPNSVFVVESDTRFQWEAFSSLAALEKWDIREYPPAVVGILKKS